MSSFDLPGALRRIRQLADLSQREPAAAAGVSPSAVGQAEAGRRDLSVGVISGMASLAGLRLGLVDARGTEVPPMSPDAVRDGADRRFPAHLDPRHSDEGWWHGPHRYDREQPWYTFDRERRSRNRSTRGGARATATWPEPAVTVDPCATASCLSAAARASPRSAPSPRSSRVPRRR